jgi:hypothetical protein
MLVSTTQVDRSVQIRVGDNETRQQGTETKQNETRHTPLRNIQHCTPTLHEQPFVAVRHPKVAPARSDVRVDLPDGMRGVDEREDCFLLPTRELALRCFDLLCDFDHGFPGEANPRVRCEGVDDEEEAGPAQRGCVWRLGGLP